MKKFVKSFCILAVSLILFWGCHDAMDEITISEPVPEESQSNARPEKVNEPSNQLDENGEEGGGPNEPGSAATPATPPEEDY